MPLSFLSSLLLLSLSRIPYTTSITTMSQTEEDEHYEDDDEEEEETESIKLLEESGLTEEERREIRTKQRSLHKEMEDKDKLEVEEARERNNELYKKVCFTREAVLDGENLVLITAKAAQKVDRLIQVRIKNNSLLTCLYICL
jgi:hypothetical protein